MEVLNFDYELNKLKDKVYDAIAGIFIGKNTSTIDIVFDDLYVEGDQILAVHFEHIGLTNYIELESEMNEFGRNGGYTDIREVSIQDIINIYHTLAVKFINDETK